MMRIHTLLLLIVATLGAGSPAWASENELEPIELNLTDALRLAMLRNLTVEQAGLYLGLSKWTVRRLIWKHAIPVVRIGRRHLLDLADLDDLIRRSKRPC